MFWLHKESNVSEILILKFKLTELLRDCSKWIIHTFHLRWFQQRCLWRLFRFLFEKYIQKNSIYKEPHFKRKLRSEITLNSEHLNFWKYYTRNKWNVENAIFSIFFWYSLNRLECKFINFNNSVVNAIQREFFLQHKKGEDIKSLLLLTLFH